jgi:Flp pilus assembly protein TadG
MTYSRHAQRGQALIMVSFSVIAMCGVIGLAVDLGWSYFVKKAAQGAADSAAMAAANQALSEVGQADTFASHGYTSHAIAPCDLAGNLHNGCQYAQENGFVPGGHGNHQNVTMQDDVASSPPTVPGITADYWVTVRTAETIPQLFSAVLGNTLGTSSARATAAVVSTIVNGSVITLNRAGDGGPAGNGVDIQLKGGDDIVAPQGVVMASSSTDAGDLRGNASVTGPTTVITGGQADWTYTNAPDGPQFLDPMRGKGQPPVTSAVLPSFGIPGGTIPDGFVLQPGNYYATKAQGGTTVASGEPLQIHGTVTFSGGAFGDYFLYGGLDVSGTVNLGAGRYVLVGSGGLSVSNGADIRQSNPSGAGELFIFTGAGASGTVTYPGVQAQINNVPLVLAREQLFGFGNVGLQSGNGQSSVNIRGLNPASGSVPSGLDPFGGVVMWQDQANSPIKYTADGNVDTTSCGSGHSIGNPCSNTLLNPNSPEMHFQANAGMNLNGVVYQPRGAWITTDGGPGTGIYGNVQLITGAIQMKGNGNINITGPPPVPLKRRIAALIE